MEGDYVKQISWNAISETS